jgi:glycyl-tRNA synthetase beta chain
LMTDFLLELLSEEIPARMQDKAREDLARLFSAELERAGLTPGKITTYATPRRLSLIINDLPIETQAAREETKGPKLGAPPQALEGFLRKTGLTQDQLEERDGIYFAIVEKPGRKTADVIAEAIPAIIRAFPWPKSQRWGAASRSTESLRWVRPLQGIIALLGDDLVPCEIDGIVSGAVTYGHRFHHKGAVTITNAGDYAAQLRAAHVILDQDERRAIIRDGAQKAAAAAGLTLVPDEGLVIENAGLTEWPVPLLGRFDPDFLSVPEEVIQLTARVNQKYFICRDVSGKLANAFVCTANIAAHDGGASIIAGNEKVLAARLSDARFFYETDLKVPLEQQAEKLKDIVFHEKLGTVADRVERIAKLARWLVTSGVIPAKAGIQNHATAEIAARSSSEEPMDSRLRGNDADGEVLANLVERAARLCKADLVTGMVGEFPELQGLMGGYYATAQGEDAQVAAAIRDHYKPVGQGDEVPSAPITLAVSLAEKLDTLTQFFGADMQPTGSKDPFALRRAALAVIRLLVENGIRYPIAETDGLLDFFLDRLKVQQREAGVRHDLIDAVIALGGEDDLVRLLARVTALQSFVTTEDGVNLLAAYKRAANILKAAQDAAPAFSGSTLLPAEADLLAALDAAEPKAASAVESEQFEAAMAALASLRAPIDAFFEGVMVNDEDPAKRAFRLGLLARFRDAVHRVADFSKIEG